MDGGNMDEDELEPEKTELMGKFLGPNAFDVLEEESNTFIDQSAERNARLHELDDQVNSEQSAAGTQATLVGPRHEDEVDGQIECKQSCTEMEAQAAAGPSCQEPNSRCEVVREMTVSDQRRLQEHIARLQPITRPNNELRGQKTSSKRGPERTRLRLRKAIDAGYKKYHQALSP